VQHRPPVNSQPHPSCHASSYGMSDLNPLHPYAPAQPFDSALYSGNFRLPPNTQALGSSSQPPPSRPPPPYPYGSSSHDPNRRCDNHNYYNPLGSSQYSLNNLPQDSHNNDALSQSQLAVNGSQFNLNQCQPGASNAIHRHQMQQQQQLTASQVSLHQVGTSQHPHPHPQLQITYKMPWKQFNPGNESENQQRMTPPASNRNPVQAGNITLTVKPNTVTTNASQPALHLTTPLLLQLDQADQETLRYQKDGKPKVTTMKPNFNLNLLCGLPTQSCLTSSRGGAAYRI
jgi:hypothetical protein